MSGPTQLCQPDLQHTQNYALVCLTCGYRRVLKDGALKVMECLGIGCQSSSELRMPFVKDCLLAGDHLLARSNAALALTAGIWTSSSTVFEQGARAQ